MFNVNFIFIIVLGLDIVNVGLKAFIFLRRISGLKIAEKREVEDDYRLGKV